jgi:transposase-like protein
MKRTRRTPKDIELLCQQFQVSGVSQAEFAAQLGVHVVTLRNWLRRWRTRQPVARAKFVEVQAPPLSTGPAAPLVVELPNGVRLRFTQQPDPAYLSQTLSALRGV